MKKTLKAILLTLLITTVSVKFPAYLSTLAETPVTAEHSKLIENLQKEKRTNTDQYKQLKESEKAFVEDFDFCSTQKLTVDFVLNPAIVIILCFAWFSLGKQWRALPVKNGSLVLFLVPLSLILLGYSYQPYIHTVVFWWGWHAFSKKKKSNNCLQFFSWFSKMMRISDFIWR